MIKCIAALDSQRGIADEHGIPWQGKVPTDIKWYHQHIEDGGLVLMGYGLYKELTRNPYGPHPNYVATLGSEPLREGFERVSDARAFLQQAQTDVWNLGGALLFESTLDLADELYITQLEGEFGCTKFFPPYEDQFECIWQSEPVTENGITFRFKRYKRHA